MKYYDWIVNQSKPELAQTLCAMEDAIELKIIEHLAKQGVNVERMTFAPAQFKFYLDLLNSEIEDDGLQQD